MQEIKLSWLVLQVHRRFTDADTSAVHTLLMFLLLCSGVVSPIFRTHGCRAGQAEILPNTSQCIHAEGMTPQGPQGSCGPNEVWSYGETIEPILSAIVQFRNDVL